MTFIKVVLAVILVVVGIGLWLGPMVLFIRGTHALANKDYSKATANFIGAIAFWAIFSQGYRKDAPANEFFYEMIGKSPREMGSAAGQFLRQKGEK